VNIFQENHNAFSSNMHTKLWPKPINVNLLLELVGSIHTADDE